MSDRSKIEWTEATWNPIRARNRATGKVGWHCVHVSPGCANCYAEGINKRLGTGLPFKPGHEKDIEIFLDERTLTQPLRWQRPRMIFPGSMTDLFADFVTDAMLDRIFAMMAMCPQHTFQILTKRSARMRAYFEARKHGDPWAEAADWVSDMVGLAEHPAVLEPKDIPLPNVWLGVSVEDQARAEVRINDLLRTPAAVRFVSAEPLLKFIDFTRCDRGDAQVNAVTGKVWYPGAGSESSKTLQGNRLDWVIVGGESGPHARPMHPLWARSIRDQCAAAGVPFFMKQWGQWHSDALLYTTMGGECPPPDMKIGKKRAGRLLDGVEHNGMPKRKSP